MPTPQEYRRISGDSGGFTVTMEWDPQTGQMNPRIPPFTAENSDDWWRHVPNLLAWLGYKARVCAWLCQQGANHPADAGLTPAPRPLTTSVTFPQPLAGELDDGILHQSGSVKVWVGPGVDPEKYGSAFVYPTFKQDSGGVVHTRWVLRLSGTSIILAEAEWDDAEACTELFAAAADAAENREAYLMQGAMMEDPEAWAAAKTRAAATAAKQSAKEAFTPHPSRRIKPRLVEQAAREAGGRVDGLGQWLRSVRCSLFAQPVTIKTFDGAGRAKNLHLAARIAPQMWRGGRGSTMPAPTLDLFAAALSAELSQHNLGQVFRYRTTDDPQGDLIVVKDPELAFAHAAALGIPEHATIDGYTPGDGWVEYCTVKYPELG